MNIQTEKPVVSVIIPTYNRAWVLGEAIESVLDQTFAAVELIVVDDGSTDQTGDILKTYASRLSVVRQKRAGVSAARNSGAKQARGKYLAFLDSDDLWKPTKLAVQTSHMESHPDRPICQTEEIWIRRGRRINPKKYHQKPSGDIFVPSLALCLVSPSAVMLQKDFYFQMGGFDERLPACEDYDFWLRISCRYPVDLIPEPLVVKRGGHDDQLSAQPGLDQYRILSLHHLIASNVLTPFQLSKTIAMLNRKIKIYADGCRKRGKYEEALRIEGLYRQPVNRPAVGVD